MENVSRNVILDLMPSYLAGEASEDSRTLVDAFAQRDPQIARMIQTGTLELAETTPNVSPPDDLEAKTLKRVRDSIRRQMVYVALATASILMIPLVAMQLTSEVKWDPADFIVMGFLLFGTGLAYVLVSKVSDNIAYRIAVGIAVVAGLMLVWVNLAVGIIGSEDNLANVLYVGVIAVGVIGAGMAQFRPHGMMRALFATALAQVLVPVIALIIWRPSLEEPPGIAGVFIINAFFAGLFVVSALLFRRASSADPK